MLVFHFVYDAPSLAKRFSGLNDAAGKSGFGGWQVSAVAHRRRVEPRLHRFGKPLHETAAARTTYNNIECAIRS